MKRDPSMQMFTLFRFPMAHSFSPWIHQAFATQFDLKLTYTQTEADLDAFKEKIAYFRSQGGIGANVTMPLKEKAYALCHHRTLRARIAQSVNTLFWRDEQLWGDNTDGIGFIRDITQNLGQRFTDKSICILGAGGAAAGIIQEITHQKPKSISLCNRTKERAEALKARFKDFPLSVISFETLHDIKPDWIINTTPFSEASLLFPLPPSLMQNVSLYELSYAKKGKLSALATFAQTYGAKAVFDGLGMLVEQAAESFCVWQNGLFPDTKPVIATLRQEMANSPD